MPNSLRQFFRAVAHPRHYFRCAYDWKAHWDILSSSDDPCFASGRDGSELQVMSTIAEDIKTKMELVKQDSALDVGCNQGDIAALLSNYVSEITGIDIANNAIKTALQRHGNIANISFFNEGIENYLQRGKKHDVILVYSVFHYLRRPSSAKKFLRLAISACKPAARILIGDIPIKELEPQYGQYNRRWFVPSESEILSYLRGLTQIKSAMLVPQPKNLPYAHYRRDLVLKLK